MSSTTNVTIKPAPPPVDVAVTSRKDVNLGHLLGSNGCQLFEQELVRLCNEKGSGWSKHARGRRDAYMCSVTHGLPAGVPNLKVEVMVSPGVVEVQQQWTLQGLDASRPEVPQEVRKAIQQIVNRTVNQALVRVIASQIRQRIADRPPMSIRVKQELKMWQHTTAKVQIHARLRQG